MCTVHSVDGVYTEAWSAVHDAYARVSVGVLEAMSLASRHLEDSMAYGMSLALALALGRALSGQVLGLGLGLEGQVLGLGLRLCP